MNILLESWLEPPEHVKGRDCVWTSHHILKAVVTNLQFKSDFTRQRMRTLIPSFWPLSSKASSLTIIIKTPQHYWDLPPVLPFWGWPALPCMVHSTLCTRPPPSNPPELSVICHHHDQQQPDMSLSETIRLVYFCNYLADGDVWMHPKSLSQRLKWTCNDFVWLVWHKRHDYFNLI